MSEPPLSIAVASEIRECPSTNAVHQPLIAQNIGVQVCLKRQRAFYHKCHRCLYRGRPAGFVLEAPEVKKPEAKKSP